jgi:hypothetical protein
MPNIAAIYWKLCGNDYELSGSKDTAKSNANAAVFQDSRTPLLCRCFDLIGCVFCMLLGLVAGFLGRFLGRVACVLHVLSLGSAKNGKSACQHSQ